MENILTVCLLNGVDSDAEFQKGCQNVMKLISLLKENPKLPSEFLMNGVRKLLEQQLPDARVIDSLPTFQSTMDRSVTGRHIEGDRCPYNRGLSIAWLPIQKVLKKVLKKLT